MKNYVLGIALLLFSAALCLIYFTNIYFPIIEPVDQWFPYISFAATVAGLVVVLGETRRKTERP